jgi:lysophospholipase L1-like esterase
MERRQFIRTSLWASSLFSLAGPHVLDAKARNVAEVVNAGVGGDNTIDVLVRIEKDCLHHHPALTIVMIGTNDMNSKKFIPLHEYSKNLETIVKLILENKSQVLLMNLLPVYEPYLFTRHDPAFYAPEGHAARLKQMNQCIENIAMDHKASFLDLHHIFSRAGNIGLERSSLIKNEANSSTTDGLHPTPEGYRMIGVSVYHHIMCSKLKSTKIVCLGDSITRGDGMPGGENYPAWLKKLLT